MGSPSQRDGDDQAEGRNGAVECPDVIAAEHPQRSSWASAASDDSYLAKQTIAALKPTEPTASDATADTAADKGFSIPTMLPNLMVELAPDGEKPKATRVLARFETGIMNPNGAEYDEARLSAKFLSLVLESVQDPLF